jgi:small subunit ribosomal protein S16
MLAIRMRPVGSKKKPYFRVVVTEAKSARESSFVENVGTCSPRETGPCGDQQGTGSALVEAQAQPSDSVARCSPGTYRATCRR